MHVSKYSLADRTDEVLLHDLSSLAARDRAVTALLLAHIAEVDTRRLYLPAGHSSMFAYCVEVLRLSEDAAYKRITVARLARRFPILFTMLEDGRLHLTGSKLLAPHLTEANVDDLLPAVAGCSRAEIEEVLAVRFPQALQLTVQPIERSAASLSTGPASSPPRPAPGPVAAPAPELAPGPVPVAAKEPPPAPLPSLERYPLHLSIGRETREKLRRAQALLSHAVPSGDVAEVLDRALDALIVELEKRKYGVTARPREPRVRKEASPPSRPPIPAHVRRAVWVRDGGRCGFVGADGRRCRETKFLEFDHVLPVAQGGTSTVENVRLCCRAHNQFEAERRFGADFMEEHRRSPKVNGVAGRMHVGRRPPD